MARTRTAPMATSPGVFLQGAAGNPMPWPLLADRFIETLAGELGINQSRLKAALKATLLDLGSDGEAQHGQPRERLSVIRTFISGASRHIGLDTNTFVERLRKGESAGAIAESEGKSREGLVGALVEKASENFGRLEAAGLLTHDRAGRELDRVRQLINRWTDHKLPVRVTRRTNPNDTNGHRELSNYGGVLH